MKQLANRLKYYLKIYFLLVKLSLVDILMFRINALIIGLAPIVWLATMIAFLMTLFSKIDTLGGWNFWEIVFLTGVHEVIFLLTWITFSQNLRVFVSEVQTGRFDQVLLKPTNPRFLVSFRLLDFTAIGGFVNALFVFFYSFNRAVGNAGFGRLLIFAFFLILAYWVTYLTYFIFASLALFFVKSEILIDWLFDTTDFDRYPAEIYPSGLRVFLTFFLPVLFFAYIPTAFLLGKVSWVYLPVGFLLALVLYFLSSYFWHTSLRRYQSASS